MENRQGNIIAALIVDAILLGALICGADYFILSPPLKLQEAQLTAMQAELGKIDALRAQLTEIQGAVRDNATGLAEFKTALRENGNALAEVQAAMRETGAELAAVKAEMDKIEAVTMGRSREMRGEWTSSEAAAADSVEGQLKAQGKHWVKTTGEFAVGSYVQDILEGRTNQPRGRGAIGKVLSLGPNDSGDPCAQVDFGRGCVKGIMLRELSLIRFVPDAAQ
ncbi:MAG: hypothetical protein ACLQU4_20550 [Limisphaerales bacterium]